VARNRIVDNCKQRPETLDDYDYENEEGEIVFKDLPLTNDGIPESNYLRELFWQQLMEFDIHVSSSRKMWAQTP
jgi:hypothetical protein